jgi:hypothetical protein
MKLRFYIALVKQQPFGAGIINLMFGLMLRGGLNWKQLL